MVTMASDHKGTITVKNVPESFDEDFLCDIFERETDDEVLKVELKRAHNVATIVFKNHSVTTKLVQRGCVQVDNTTLEILPYIGPRKLPQTKQMNSKVVCIKCIPEHVTDARLKIFLENTKRGGPIEKIIRNPTRTVVTFQHAKDAAKLVSLKTMMIGQALDVTYYESSPEDIKAQRTVYIAFKGISRDEMDEDFLEYVLDRTGDNYTIEESKLLPDQDTREVVFDKAEAAEFFIQLGVFKDVNLELAITRLPQKLPKNISYPFDKTLVVRGFKTAVSKERLETYFENKKRTNGGPVASVTVYNSSHFAVLTFEQKEDAERVLTNKMLKLDGHPITTEWYANDPLSEQDRYTVLVYGVSGFDKDTLEEIFEDEHISGGGDIAEITKDADIAMIKFKEKEVAQRALKRKFVSFEWQKMTVRLPKHLQQHKSSKVIVQNTKDITADLLKSDLQDYRRRARVQNIEAGANDDTMIVEFANVEDARDIIGTHTFGDRTCTFKEYEEDCVDVYNSPGNDVLVDGLNGLFEREDIEDLFENETLSSGGPIEKVDLNANRSRAVITFKNYAVAERVIQKGQVVYEGNVLTCKSPTQEPVQAPSNQSSTSSLLLEVNNIKQEVTKEMVTLFLEKMSEGSISDLQYNSKDGRAIVKFEDKKDVYNVIQKHKTSPLQLEGRQLSIKTLDPSKMNKHDWYLTSCAVEITDLGIDDESLDNEDEVNNVRENLQLLFENKNMTNGGTIEELYLSPYLKTCVITFQQPEVAENVYNRHNRDPIYLDDQKLKITLLSCPKTVQVIDGEMQPNMLILSNIPCHVTPEDIITYFKHCKTAGKVKTQVFGLTPGKVLVEFCSIEDYGEIFERLRMKPLKGNMISAERVKMTRQIEVYGIEEPKKLSKQNLKMYFEHKQRSKGGDIENVTMDNSNHCAIVTFKRPQDALNVVNQEEHAILRQQITVKLHHDCIGVLPEGHDSSVSLAVIPIILTTEVAKPNSEIIQFITQSSSMKHSINQSMKKLNAKLIWSTLWDNKVKNITLECILDAGVSNYEQLNKSWESDVKKEVLKIFSEIKITVIPVSDKILGIMGKLIEQYSQKHDDIFATCCKDESLIKIVGNQNCIHKAQKDINQKLKKEEENQKKTEQNRDSDIADHQAKMEKKSQNQIQPKSAPNTEKQKPIPTPRKSIQTKNKLPKHKIQFLKVTKFGSDMKNVQVQLDEENGTVTFQGNDGDKKQAEIELYKALDSMKTEQVQVPPEKLKMYHRPSVKQYVYRKFTDDSLDTICFDVKANVIEIYGKSNILLKRAAVVLSKCVSSKMFHLKDQPASILTSHKWQEFSEDVCLRHKDCACITEEESSVKIVSTNDIIDQIFNEVTKFASENTDREAYVSTKKGFAKLLKDSRQVQEIQQRYPVVICISENTPRQEITIKGPSDEVEKAEGEIKDFVRCMSCETYTVKQPGLSEFFLDESRRSLFTAVEDRHKVVIEMGDEEDLTKGASMFSSRFGKSNTRSPHNNELIIVIYGFNSRVTRKAYDDIDRICRAQCQEMKIDGTEDSQRIRELTREQIQRINDLESVHKVKIDIDRNSNGNEIRILGMHQQTATAYVDVKNILVEAEETEHRTQMAKDLYEKVNWQYFDNEFVNYPVDINYIIEDAYKLRKPFVTWKQNGREYNLHFNLLQESIDGSARPSVNVRRYAPLSVELPDTWEHMSQRQSYLVKTLKASDLEYETVAKTFGDSMITGRSGIFNNIVSIKRIQIPKVFMSYTSNKACCEMKNTALRCVEKDLWFGCSADNIDEISTNGINRTLFGKDGDYGKGVYFAVNAPLAHEDTSTAADNSRIICRCKVITGEITTGQKGIKVPPVKDANSNRKYDSVVDQIQGSTVFVVFLDDLVYPEYIITYN